MLVENAEYSEKAPSGKLLNGGVFRYCRFASFNEGGHVDATFLRCGFEGVDWYWTLFNCCVFVGCTFTQCKFRGVSFPDCIFVECRFDNCQFLEDNLKGTCSAEGARVYASTATNCVGEEVLFVKGAL